MLSTNVSEAKAGFRLLNAAEIQAVSGGTDNEIIVTGNTGDIWTVSVSPDDLALLGIFNLGGGDGLPGTTDQFGGDGGGGGGGAPPADPNAPQLSEADRQQALNANEDSEFQEAVERTLEAILNFNDPQGASWTYEYNETTGFYVGLSSDGRSSALSSQDANTIYNNSVT